MCQYAAERPGCSAPLGFTVRTRSRETRASAPVCAQRARAAWASLKVHRLLCVPMQKLMHAHSLAHTHVLTGGKQFAKYTNHAVKSQLGPSWTPGGGEVVSSKEAHPLRMDKAVCACPSFFPVTPKTQRPTPCVSVNQRCRRGLRTPSLARSCRLTFALKRSSLLITCPHTRNVCTRNSRPKKT